MDRRRTQKLENIRVSVCVPQVAVVPAVEGAKYQLTLIQLPHDYLTRYPILTAWFVEFQISYICPASVDDQIAVVSQLLQTLFSDSRRSVQMGRFPMPDLELDKNLGEFRGCAFADCLKGLLMELGLKFREDDEHVYVDRPIRSPLSVERHKKLPAFSMPFHCVYFIREIPNELEDE